MLQERQLTEIWKILGRNHSYQERNSHHKREDKEHESGSEVTLSEEYPPAGRGLLRKTQRTLSATKSQRILPFHSQQEQFPFLYTPAAALINFSAIMTTGRNMENLGRNQSYQERNSRNEREPEEHA